MAGLPEWRNKPSVFIKWHHVDVLNKKPGRHVRMVRYTPRSETARNGSNPENVWGSWKQMTVEMFYIVAIRNAGKQSREGWSSFPLSIFQLTPFGQIQSNRKAQGENSSSHWCTLNGNPLQLQMAQYHSTFGPGLLVFSLLLTSPMWFTSQPAWRR